MLWKSLFVSTAAGLALPEWLFSFKPALVVTSLWTKRTCDQSAKSATYSPGDPLNAESWMSISTAPEPSISLPGPAIVESLISTWAVVWIDTCDQQPLNVPPELIVMLLPQAAAMAADGDVMPAVAAAARTATIVSEGTAAICRVRLNARALATMSQSLGIEDVYRTSSIPRDCDMVASA